MIVLADWGTTNLRAWHVDESGRVLSKHASDMGLRSAESIGFLKVLQDTLGHLNASPDTPALLCGMVGSQKGWQEAPYTPMPADAQDLAAQITAVDERPYTWIVGGVCSDKSESLPEVIRGEEVQALGILNTHDQPELLCIPGTHSKWLGIRDDKIADIATYMTGEMFGLIAQHSIISTQITSDAFNEQAFDRGLELSKQPTAFTHTLFQLRTQYLFDRVPPDDVHAMASGLLIGSEIGDVVRRKTPERVHLCGSPTMNQRYQRACDHFQLPCIEIDAEQATLDGLNNLWTMVPHD